MVACSLLKYTQFRKDSTGESWELFYLRDKEDREVDFVVTLNRRVHWLIEVKASDANPSTSLRHYSEKLRPRESIQLVLNLERAQEKSGIKVLPLGKWLEALPFGDRFRLGEPQIRHSPCRKQLRRRALTSRPRKKTLSSSSTSHSTAPTTARTACSSAPLRAGV